MERDEPDRLDEITNEQEVLEDPHAGHVEVDVEECQAHELTIEVEAFGIHLG